jgi:GT2 family glycosyltransferase
MTRVSVVVVTRNRATRLEALLASLAAQNLAPGEFEVIVVDDGSTDETPAAIERRADGAGFPLRAVRIDDRPGIAGLRNAGWRMARAPLVAFVDDDCEATAGWLAAGLAAWDGDPDSVIQGRTTPIARELEQLGPLSRTKLIEAAGPWYQTCNIFYPRELLDRLGGFDESFAVAGEDTDLGWRAREAGAEIAYAADAHVEHAVERIGVSGWLAIARRERVLSPLFARHPGLRAEIVSFGVFKGDRRARFALALAGLFLAGRFRPAALLVLPYLRSLVSLCRAFRAGPQWAVWYTLYDAILIAYSARGAAESNSRLI